MILTFTVSLSADNQPGEGSPPKKRKTEDNRDSSVELGSEDSFSVSETGVEEAEEGDSDFLDNESYLEDIKEDVEYYSPSKTQQDNQMMSNLKGKRKSAKGGSDAVELLSMLQGLKVGSSKFSDSPSIIPLTSKPCTVNFLNHNPFMCYL